MFNFNGLNIYNECKYRKNLDAERNEFCTTVLKDYFCKNDIGCDNIATNGTKKSPAKNGKEMHEKEPTGTVKATMTSQQTRQEGRAAT